MITKISHYIIIILALIILSICTQLANSSLSQESYTPKIKNALNQNELNVKNLKLWHDGLLSLYKLGEDVPKEYGNLCEKIEALEASTLSETLYAVVVDIVLKCPERSEQDKLNQRVKKAISIFLDSSRKEINAKDAKENLPVESLENYSLFSRLILLKKKFLNKIIQKESLFLKKIYAKLVSSEAWLGYDALANRAEAIVSLSKVLGGAKDSDVFDGLFSVSKQIGDLSKNIVNASPKEVSLFAKSIYKITSLSKVTSKLSQEYHSKIAQILYNFKVEEDSSFVSDVYDQIDAIKSLESSPFDTPIVVGDLHVENNRIEIEAKRIDGKAPEKATLKKIQLSGSKKKLLENAELTVLESGKLVYDYSKNKELQKALSAQLGHFIFDFEFNGVQITKHLTYSTELNIKSFYVSIVDKSDKRADREHVEYPRQSSFSVLDASKQFLEVEVELVNAQGEALNPEQVFLRVSPIRSITGQEILLSYAKEKTLKLVKSRSGVYTSKVDLSVEARSIDAVYAFELIVADSFISNPIQWRFGQFEIKFEKSYEPTLEEQRWSLRKEIFHQFPPIEKRSHGILTQIFSLIVPIPLIVFILVVLKISGGSLFKQCPQNPIALLANVILQLCVLAMIGVLVMYFFSWKIMQVMKALLSIAFVASLVGTFALKSVYNKRVKSQ